MYSLTCIVAGIRASIRSYWQTGRQSEPHQVVILSEAKNLATPERAWTILFIGGCSAVGKSTLACACAAHLDARVVDTDLFWMVLRRTVPYDVAPDLHFFTSEACWSLPTDELVERYLRVSRFVCDAIEVVVAHYASIGVTAIIEGCWVLPAFALQERYAGRDNASVRKALFLYEPSIDELKQRLRVRPGGSPEREPKSVRDANVQMQWQFGLEIKRQAEALGLPVLESRPYDTLLDRALALLNA